MFLLEGVYQFAPCGVGLTCIFFSKKTGVSSRSSDASFDLAQPGKSSSDVSDQLGLSAFFTPASTPLNTEFTTVSLVHAFYTSDVG
ncbi:hypothetical protein [Neolewinella persica]|uniref:hypothetical protein n=1 Tax=Neolewinella persica TaxID=70998 RepID=UPI0012FA3A07|nr:hypothetical protein [Neolewinella persica]